MYDVVAIGTESAGTTAALYASRSDLSVLMIEQGAPGDQVNNTAEIENHPGFDSIMGPDLAYKTYEGVSRFGIESIYGIVQDIRGHGNHEGVICGGKTYKGKTIIIATDCIRRKLDVPGKEEFVGRGISYCIVCGDAFFRSKCLVMVGRGDLVVGEAIYLTQLVSEVAIAHRRDGLHTQKIIQDHALANEKASLMWDTVVGEIVEDEMIVTGVKARNVKAGNEFDLATDRVFIYVGLDPLTAPFREAGLTNEAGWIPTDSEMKTNIPDVPAIGDAREKDLRQIITAVGDGRIVGQQMYKYLEPLEETTT